MRTTLTLLFLTFLCTCVRAQKSNLELLYLHTDRTYYHPGEMIWLRAYLTGGDGCLDTPQSDVVHLDLLDAEGARIDSLALYRGVNGHDGFLQLKQALPGGKYTLVARTNWQANFGPAAFYRKNIYVQRTFRPNLLIELEPQREAFGPGTTVRYHLAVKDREGKPASGAEVLAELRVNGKIKASKKVKTDLLGEYLLELPLAKDLKTTDVVLSTRVSYEAAAETILRPVPVVLQNITLAFFPEGGMRAGMGPQKIAFRATDVYGKPVDVAGEVFDYPQWVRTFYVA